MRNNNHTLIIGSYSDQLGVISPEELSHKIYHPPQSGVADTSLISSLPLNPAPSWLHYDKENCILYAVEEDDTPKLFIYEWSKLTTTPTLLHSYPTGASPCHISLIPNSKKHGAPMIWVSNYNGGSYSVFYPSQEKLNFTNLKMLTFPQALAEGTASSPPPEVEKVYHKRLAENSPSHPHCTILAPNQKGVFATDLGYDLIYYFEFSDDEYGVRLKSVSETPKGFGPRHLCLSKNRTILYVNCELTPFIMTYQINDDNSLTPIEQYPVYGDAQQPLMPSKQITAGSEIALHPTLPILYHANRSIDLDSKAKGDITVYEIENDYTLAIKETYALVGDCPRHFTVDPSGTKLLVALQKSDIIEVLDIRQNGKLSFSHTISYPKPSYLAFI